MRIVSPIEAETSLFIQFLSKFDGTRPDTYSTSFAYHALTGRNGLKMYIENEDVVLVCVHPNIDNQVLLFPELNGVGRTTINVIHKLLDEYDRVELARFTNEDYSGLVDQIEAAPIGQTLHINNRYSTEMDWLYPVRILDTRYVTQASGNDIAKFRNQVNRFRDRNIADVSPLTNSSSQIASIRSITAKWDKDKQLRDNSKHDRVSFYGALIELIKEYPDKFNGFILSVHGTDIGFSIWALPDGKSDTANGVASLTDHHKFPCSSEFLTWETCRFLQQDSISFYNIGGSEDAGLNHFKRKAQPKNVNHITNNQLVIEMVSAVVSH